jgi:hypothetical protein
MLFYTKELTNALADRFDDLEEIQFVAKHGCQSGVSGFCYYHETNAFFKDHEDDVEDVCHDILGEDYLQHFAKRNTSIQGLINEMVWFVVETYCQNMADHADSIGYKVTDDEQDLEAFSLECAYGPEE